MSDAMPLPGSQEWLDSVIEDVVDPDAPIIDPHHHLWPEGGALAYGLDQLHADTGDGHNVVDTVFVECGAGYRTGGDERFAAVGETEFVAAEAERRPRPVIGGIVAHADLTAPRASTTCSMRISRRRAADSAASATPGPVRNTPRCS